MTELLITLAISIIIIFFAFRWEWKQLPIRERRQKQEELLRAARRANQAFIKFGVEIKPFQKALIGAAQDLNKFYKEMQATMKENVGHRSDKWN